MNILLTSASLMEQMVSIIGNLGFPIVMSILLIRQNEKLEERHEKESQEFTKVISANTTAIEKLSALIAGKE